MKLKEEWKLVRKEWAWWGFLLAMVMIIVMCFILYYTSLDLPNRQCWEISACDLYQPPA